MGLLYIAKTNEYFELISHFATFYSIVSLCYLIFYILFKRKYLGGVALVMCFVTASQWIPLLLPEKNMAQDSGRREISILQLNIWNRIETVDQTIKLINEKGFPDIVLFQEITPDLLNKLKSLNSVYPYRFEAPEDGAYGMAIYSKIPISYVSRKDFKVNNNSYTIVRFKKTEGGVALTMVELHALSPARDMYMNQRKMELDEISRVINNLPGKNIILLGDLNTTPYSPYFAKLLKNSGLKNSMQGRRIEGTWPNFIPFFLRIPLDNMIVSQDLCVVKQEVCSDVGSDHMPVLTHLKIKE